VESTHSLIMTEQRRVILEELRKVVSHPTADEVYALVRKRLPNISLGTVYRNLETLSSAGIIQKLETAGSQMRFDAVVENHYHVRCVKCGRVDDVPVPRIEAIEQAARGVEGYRVLSYRLEFMGLCPSCREKRDEETSICRVEGAAAN
jgi:Fur family transcriptional regulator, ferric uptake regulator